MSADVYRLREAAVRWREIGDEIVAVDLGSSTYITTNASGLYLWRRLVDGASDEDLVGELVLRFGIEEERAAADVERFLSELRGRDLLET